MTKEVMNALIEAVRNMYANQDVSISLSKDGSTVLVEGDEMRGTQMYYFGGGADCGIFVFDGKVVCQHWAI
jgi:hypothetical protein